MREVGPAWDAWSLRRAYAEPNPDERVGLGVVVDRTRSKTFIARARVGKKRHRVKIGVAGNPRPDGLPWIVALSDRRCREQREPARATADGLGARPRRGRGLR